MAQLGWLLASFSEDFSLRICAKAKIGMAMMEDMAMSQPIACAQAGKT